MRRGDIWKFVLVATGQGVIGYVAVESMKAVIKSSQVLDVGVIVIWVLVILTAGVLLHKIIGTPSEGQAAQQQSYAPAPVSALQPMSSPQIDVPLELTMLLPFLLKIHDERADVSGLRNPVAFLDIHYDVLSFSVLRLTRESCTGMVSAEGVGIVSDRVEWLPSYNSWTGADHPAITRAVDYHVGIRVWIDPDARDVLRSMQTGRLFLDDLRPMFSVDGHDGHELRLVPEGWCLEYEQVMDE